MMNPEALNPEIETLFMMPAEKYTYVSSRLIKGVFRLGGDVTALVPPLVMERLKAKNLGRAEMTLQDQFGRIIDIYVFDQLLAGQCISRGMTVLDAGCGGGRNLVYLLREGFEVFGCDRSAEAVQYVRDTAGELAPGLPAENFQVAAIEKMPFPDACADVVICNAVLHFARDSEHFSRDGGSSCGGCCGRMGCCFAGFGVEHRHGV